jgi:hypothetical protein
MIDESRQNAGRSRLVWFGMRRRTRFVAPDLLTGAGATYAKAKSERRGYESSAGLLFQQSGTSQQLFGDSKSSITDSIKQDAASRTLVTGPAVAQATATALHIPLSEVRASVPAAGACTIVDLTARALSPSFVRRLVNTYVRMSVTYRKRSTASSGRASCPSASLLRTQSSFSTWPRAQVRTR